MPRCQRSRREHDGTRVVLEHPAGEVAARPRREAGGADRGARARSASAAGAGAAPANRRSVPSARSTSRRYRAATAAAWRDVRDRARREHAGLERLRDAFAGHRVDDVRGVAGEQHAAVREARGGRTTRGSATRGACRRARRRGPRIVAQLRPVDDVAPLRGELLARSRAVSCVAQHAEADVGAPAADAGTPTRTRAAGRPRTAPTAGGRRRRGSTGGTRATCRARGRARGRGVEHAAHGGVVAVGGDDPRAAHRRCRRRASTSTASSSRRRAATPTPVADRRRPRRARGRRARRRARRGAPRRRTRRRRAAGATTSRPLGDDEHGLGDRRVRRQRPDVEPERLEQAQRAGGEAVAAGLVAGEPRLVDHEHVEAEAAGLDRGGDAGRPGADDEHVDARPSDGHRRRYRLAPAAERRFGIRAHAAARIAPARRPDRRARKLGVDRT